MSGREQRLAELREGVREVAPEEAYRLARGSATLLDVRDPEEWAEGSPSGAVRLGRSFLELKVEDAIPGMHDPVLVLCASGTRSLFAAESLLQLGYQDVRSVAGGYAAWKRAGLPSEHPRTLSAQERGRYARQMRIPEIGEQGQEKLLASRVLLVGAGALGSPAALYLVAAGVGTLGIVDADTVELSNLQRQILHTTDRVGTPKTESAWQTLHALNPSIQITTHPLHLDSTNAEEVVRGYDLVIDGTDNFPARYLLNDVCLKLKLPYVYGSIYRFEGQVSVFWPAAAPADAPTPCYRCLYPAPAPPELAPSCAEAGVLGVLPGVIGTLQAVEALKLLLSLGETLIGRLLCYDATTATFREFKTTADPQCPYCSKPDAFPGYIDYDAFCRDAQVA
ncbi:MAG TPA: molybdopterin-synthase adenylyltransferase MoeB [Rhodanobacter sp.]|jgi:molybdopterin/thiamine biosynthesis adenylyltransferase/rhodanese-related sulfurtransferase|nr:molybdopterin-synthase adenylyltransferase MoeB [Rhodanobacter sp.]